MKTLCVVLWLLMLANSMCVHATKAPAADSTNSEKIANGPSMAATAEFIEDKLQSLSSFSVVVNREDGNRNTVNGSKLTNVKVDAANCRWEDIRGKWEFQNVETLKVQTVMDAENEADAKGSNPNPIVSVSAQVFYLRVYMKKGSGLSRTTVDENGRVVSTEYGFPIDYWFFDEEMANRVARAFQHAVELCGGGSNDPF